MSQYHLLKTILSPLNSLGTLVKSNWLLNVWIYFWDLNSISCQYHTFDYCSLEVSFETDKCEASNFVLLQDFGFRVPCNFKWTWVLAFQFYKRPLKFKKFYFIFLAVLGLRCSVQGFLWLLWAGTALHCGTQALGSQASALAPWGLISWGSWAVSSGSAGSVVMAQGLTCSVLCMWNPPGPGTEPVSPALADGFLSTGPPGKSPLQFW